MNSGNAITPTTTTAMRFRCCHRCIKYLLVAFNSLVGVSTEDVSPLVVLQRGCLFRIAWSVISGHRFHACVTDRGGLVLVAGINHELIHADILHE